MWLFNIYRVQYDLHVYSGNATWWCETCKKWMDYPNENHSKERDHWLSSAATYKSKRKAMKDFIKLTSQGIDCVLNDRKIIWFKGWYFCNEWHSKDQFYFGEDINDSKNASV